MLPSPERYRSRRVRQIANAVLAAVVCALLLVILGAGYGTIPGLGPALDPGHGAWASASDALLPRSQTLHLSGLDRPVQVAFTGQGLASIRAATDRDMFLALGYVHARFRLTEMDLERRLAEGRLAQLTGPTALASDRFELKLGLLRTAQQEWAAMPKSGSAARALVSYARGVNDYLATLRSSGHWPALFSLAGVYPANWTPVDSLLIQGDLTQEMDFTTTPLDYALLEPSLGAARTMSWFPVQATGPQSPYDPGPYRNLGITPLPAAATPAGQTAVTAAQVASPAAAATPAGHQAAIVTQAASPAAAPAPAGIAQAAAAILAQVGALPAGQLHGSPDSNAWAANGGRAAGGRALLAGDPHLPQTLPSAWYQVALAAPGLAVSGVSIPGLPGILIGHTANIAWSLTDTQNQSTMFYDEQTSTSRPGEYFWRGRWRRMRQLHYTIPVRGGTTRRMTVDLTVHGPVLTKAGQTVAVDWMGAIASPDVSVLLAITQARDFAQFRSALASWRAPTLNFVYADRRGNIGAISAGYFPLVRHGAPWLPMPGTGADDVSGVIPYAAVPHAYDPRSHVIVTANQRPVSSSYPYYIGTTANAFDPGFRAATEYAYLRRRSSMSSASFATLQASLTDQLARQVVPRLLAALPAAGLSPAELQARAELVGWNDQMGAGSAAASVWWTFWTDYLSVVFRPWWTALKVPTGLDRTGLAIGPDRFSLDEVLESWTLHDRHNAAFRPPGQPAGDAASAMTTSFRMAVSSLQGKLGGAPTSWTWGRLHSRQFPSLTHAAAALGYGPRAAGGDPWTVDAADGGLAASTGPSWRMITGWTGTGRTVSEGIYPGGQSENPASAWYENLFSDWWDGRYLSMPSPDAAAGPVHWELRP